MARVQTRKPKYRIQKRFIFFVLFIVTLVVLLGYCLLRPQSYRVFYASLPSKTEMRGVFIFNETRITLPEAARQMLSWPANSPIAAGGEYAAVYKKGFPENIYKDLLDVQTNIVIYQNNNIIKDINDVQLTQYDFAISRIVKELQQKESGVTFTARYAELVREVSGRAAYVRENFNPNPYLSQLYANEQEKLAALAEWYWQGTAPEDAVISYNAYGDSGHLTGEIVKNISASDVNRALSAKFGQTNLTAMENGVRLIKTDACYFAFNGRGHGLSVGDSVSFYVRGQEKPIKARVFNVKEDTTSTVVLEITENVAAYVGLNAEYFTLGAYTQGFCVPSSYVRKQNDRTYLSVEKAGGKSLIDVTVLMDNGEYAVLESADAALKMNALVFK